MCNSQFIVHCPFCGTGFLENYKNGKFICSHCQVIVQECSICDGYGYYSRAGKIDHESDFENCQHCHGTGFVLAEEE